MYVHVHVYVLVHAYICFFVRCRAHILGWLWKQEECVRVTGRVVIACCVWWKLKLDPLEEEKVLLNSEPSLHSIELFYDLHPFINSDIVNGFVECTFLPFSWCSKGYSFLSSRVVKKANTLDSSLMLIDCT